MNDFLDWLNDTIKAKGWSNNELSRRANVSSATVSNLFNGRHAITFDLCVNLSNALHVPPEDILRRAGLLPPGTGGERVQSAGDDDLNRMGVRPISNDLKS